MTTPLLTKKNDRSTRLEVGSVVELTRLIARQAAVQQFNINQRDTVRR